MTINECCKSNDSTEDDEEDSEFEDQFIYKPIFNNTAFST